MKVLATRIIVNGKAEKSSGAHGGHHGGGHSHGGGGHNRGTRFHAGGYYWNGAYWENPVGQCFTKNSAGQYVLVECTATPSVALGL